MKCCKKCGGLIFRVVKLGEIYADEKVVIYECKKCGEMVARW